MTHVPERDRPNPSRPVAAYILARVGELRATAHAATAGPWSLVPADADPAAPTPHIRTATRTAPLILSEDDEEPDLAYIAAVNPSTALAWCAAAEALARWARKERGQDAEGPARYDAVRRMARAFKRRPDGTVHPDWRKEWEL